MFKVREMLWKKSDKTQRKIQCLSLFKCQSEIHVNDVCFIFSMVIRLKKKMQFHMQIYAFVHCIIHNMNFFIA